MARDNTTAADGGKADHDEHRGTVDFAEVLRSSTRRSTRAATENGPISNRKCQVKRDKDHVRDKDPVYDTIGLAYRVGEFALPRSVLAPCRRSRPPARWSKWTTSPPSRAEATSAHAGRGSAAHEEKEGLPFPSALKAKEPPALRHIRDHSNYLIPRGLRDVPISLVIYLRGIVANIVLVLPWLLLARSRSHLSDAAALEVEPKLTFLLFSDHRVALECSRIWAVFRSSRAEVGDSWIPERCVRTYVLGLAIVAFFELQPHILHAPVTSGCINVVMTLGAGWQHVARLFGNKLACILMTRRFALGEIEAVLIKALFLAALALPVIVWLIYVRRFVHPGYRTRLLGQDFYFSTAFFDRRPRFLTPMPLLHRLYRDRQQCVLQAEATEDAHPVTACHSPQSSHVLALTSSTRAEHSESRHANQRGRTPSFFCSATMSERLTLHQTKAIESAQPWTSDGDGYSRAPPLRRGR